MPHLLTKWEILRRSKLIARIELFEIASTKIVNMLNYCAGDQFILLLKYCQKYVSNFLNQAYDIRKTKDLYMHMRNN